MHTFWSKIGGSEVPSNEVAVVSCPFDGHPVAKVGVGSDSHIQAAIESAARGFEVLRRMPTHQRAGLLERIAAGIQHRAAEFSRLITEESGKPIRYARAEVARAVTTFTLAAAEARTWLGETWPLDQQPGQEGRLCVVRRAPRGPVAAIAPFNFPLNLVAHKLAPALAVGASVVLKPPAQSPLTAHLLSAVVDDSGAPSGAFDVVHCPPEVGQRLVEDDRLRVLSFTGSDSLGWRLKQLAPKKQVILELGGNAPCIVDDGVDLQAVLPRILESAWANGGQICIKAQRIFVHSRSYPSFLERFVADTQKLGVGDPMDEQTVVGPLIEARHVARVLEWVQQACAAGARMLCGGASVGQTVLPTVLTDTTEDSRVRALEVFGPVTVVERAASFEDALELANAGRYGLQASVFTPRLEHALLAYDRLDFGAVLINDAPSFRVDNYPYGGTRDSGFGREGVRATMEELTEPKVLVMRA
ncbi:MAG: aldehyde dehydrogenase family protein [Polyangiaceae bacterium]|nr:aldehyde dehydrogenase family protein [Polyangiaceae bacterium]